MVLSFQGFDLPNSIGLDDVSVSTTSPVPEPSSLLLILTGIVSLGEATHRKISRQT
jgi:hypothetical protein